MQIHAISPSRHATDYAHCRFDSIGYLFRARVIGMQPCSFHRIEFWINSQKKKKSSMSQRTGRVQSI